MDASFVAHQGTMFCHLRLPLTFATSIAFSSTQVSLLSKDIMVAWTVVYVQVFRVMLRASRSNEALNLRHYSYVGHCYVHGESYRVGWRGLSQAWCRWGRAGRKPGEY